MKVIVLSSILLYIVFIAFSEKPQPPQGVELENLNEATVNLSWTPPTENGDAPVQHYVVEKQEVGGDWKMASVIDAKENSVKIGGLKDDKAYNFRSVHSI